MGDAKKSTDVIGKIMEGMDTFLSSKTVVGEPVKVSDVTLIPLTEVSFGMGSATNNGEKGDKAGGGMGGRMTPVAVVVVKKDGSTRLVNVKNQDAMTKILDLIPELVGRFTEPKDKEHDVTNDEAIDAAFESSSAEKAESAE